MQTPKPLDKTGQYRCCVLCVWGCAGSNNNTADQSRNFFFKYKYLSTFDNNGHGGDDDVILNLN